MIDLCPHSRLRTFALILRDAEQRPEAVSLSVFCHECGIVFEFVGAQSTPTMLVAENREEIRVYISPKTKKGGQAEA